MAVELRMESILGVLARTLAIVAVAGSAVRFGAVYVDTQLVVCLLVLAALILAMLRPRTRPLEGQPWLVVCLAGWSLWLAVLGMQLIPLPSSLVGMVSPAAESLRSTLGPESIAATSTIALLPGKASTAWATQVIAFGFFLVGAVCWRTREQRNYLFAALVLGGVLFAAWGLLNRSRGTLFLLPGIEAPDRSHPFSTLIYKNAGASLLLLSLATSIGCLLEALRPAIRQKMKQIRSGTKRESRSDGGYSQQARWAEPQVFLLIGVIGLLCVGIAFTLSRGIWIVSAATLLVWLACARRFLSMKLLLAAGFLLMCASIAVFAQMRASENRIDGGESALLKRASTLNVDSLSTNDRFAHWADASETLKDFPVLGAGLGSYGYVQLVNQDVDTPRWFEHAHNMVLEWAVETGIVGVVLLLVVLFAYAMLLRRLYRKRFESTVFLTSFSVGLIAGLGLFIQSLFDFTLLTPVVAWSHALVLGAVATTGNERRQRGRSIEILDPDDLKKQKDGKLAVVRLPLTTRLRRIAGRPFAWSLAASVLLLCAQAFLQREIMDERVLSKTRVPNFNLIPSDERIADATSQIQKRIGNGTSNGKLYQRLAQWKFAAFRSGLIQQAKASGQELSWMDTAPESMFRIFHRLADENKAVVIEQWTSAPNGREQIEATVVNLDASLACNPLVPQVQLQQALLTPLSGRSIQRSIDNARGLSASNAVMQFQLGLMGHAIDDDELMVDQWQRSLAYAPENTGIVLDLAAQKMSPEDIAARILGRIRPHIWVSLASKSLNDPRLALFRDAFQQGALNSIKNSRDLSPARTSYLSSRVYESQGKYEQAAKELKNAVSNDGGNLSYRRRYALNLMRTGALPEAREQLMLATALQPGNKELLELLSKVEREMKSQSQRQAPPKR
ncbi:MAG: O-antigen ligase family protein [Rubripirellula sp.]